MRKRNGLLSEKRCDKNANTESIALLKSLKEMMKQEIHNILFTELNQNSHLNLELIMI